MVISMLINSSNYKYLKNFLSSNISVTENIKTYCMFVIMEVVDFIYFGMHSCIVFFPVFLSLLFILILVQVDRP